MTYIPVAEFVFRHIWKVETPFIVLLLGAAIVVFSVMSFRARLSRVIASSGALVGTIALAGGALGRVEPVLLLAVWYVLMGIELTRIARQNAERRPS
jgi:hypothetical protein